MMRRMKKFPDLYAFVMRHLRAKAIPQRQVAAESGVPFSTVAKIAQGANKDPGVHTMQRLADYFCAVDPASSHCCALGHDDQQHVAKVEAA
jgi:transcriptional regulator with XRE-family HTH domain